MILDPQNLQKLKLNFDDDTGNNTQRRQSAMSMMTTPSYIQPADQLKTH